MSRAASERLCRILGAGAVASAGGLHLQLWATGYNVVSVIGPLFLLFGIASSLMALALVALTVAPGRRPLVTALGSAMGAALEMGAIAGLALASTTGLFGFHQLGAGVGGDIVAAYAIEGLAAALLAASIWLGWERAPLLQGRRVALVGGDERDTAVGPPGRFRGLS